MSQPPRKSARESLSSYCTAAGVVLLVIGLVLSVADIGEAPTVLGLVLLVVGQLLNPFWHRKPQPASQPAETTLADAGVLGVVKGVRYKATEAAKISVFVHWKPMGGFTHDDTLPAGTLVGADFDHTPEMNFVSVMPADYGALEKQLVSESDRGSGNYQGYSVTVSPAEFAAKFVRF
jgi:hypothetical protein